LVIARSLPSLWPAPRDARHRLPARGSRGRWFPPCLGTRLCEDDHPVPLGWLRLALASHYRACVGAFVVALQGAWPRRSAWPTPGRLVARSPPPGVVHGDGWCSHGPACPRCRPAPRSDPGGVPGARPGAARTVACRPRETVGLPRPTALREILLATTRPLAGLQHAAGLLVPSRCVRPLRGWPGACTPDWLARHASGGTCALARTHGVATTRFMGFHPLPRSRADLGATSAELSRLAGMV